MQELERNRENTDFIKALYQKMRNEETTMENLNAMRFLDELDDNRKATGLDYSPTYEDIIHEVYSPWRRFFARSLDISLYGFLWSAILLYIFRIEPVELLLVSFLVIFRDYLIGALLMLFIKPVLISKFATTPGKAIFGLTIKNLKGNYLTYREGFDRTFGVIKWAWDFKFLFITGIAIIEVTRFN